MSILLLLSKEVFLPVLIFTCFGLGITLFNLLVKHFLQGSESFVISLSSQPNKGLIAHFGDSLLSCLHRASIAIPSPCGGKGTCHQCRVRVIEGGGKLSNLEEGVFSRKEIQDGWRLSCQVKLKEAVKVTIPDGALAARSLSGRVISNHNVSTFIKEIIVDLDEPFEYESGEFLQIHIPSYVTSTSSWKDGIDSQFHSAWEKYGMFGSSIIFETKKENNRAYSLASYPKEGSLIRFTVRIASPPIKNGVIHPSVPWGIGSSFLFSRQKEDRLSFSGPFGESKMIHDERPVYFLIGGAGASFARSHVMSLFYLHKTKRQITLWYGARSLRENIYFEEFLDLQKKFQNFTYRLVLSEPTKEDIESNWPLQDREKTGFLFQAFETGVLQNLTKPSESLYYVCGPPVHNQAVIELLKEYGIPNSSVILDNFVS